MIARHPWIAGAPEVRRSRSKLFNTQKTLRRLKDLNKGDLKPGMTMKEFRGRPGQATVFNLFPGIANEAGNNTPKATTPKPPDSQPASQPAPSQPVLVEPKKEEAPAKKQPDESKPKSPAKDKDREKEKEKEKDRKKKSPRDNTKVDSLL